MTWIFKYICYESSKFLFSLPWPSPPLTKNQTDPIARTIKTTIIQPVKSAPKINKNLKKRLSIRFYLNEIRHSLRKIY